MYKLQIYARMNNWNPIIMLIEQDKPSVSVNFLIELCNGHGQSNLAAKAAQNIKGKDDRIQTLMELGQWPEAIACIFKYDREEYLEDVRRKGPPSVL
jgi:hypothetical protein